MSKTHRQVKCEGCDLYAIWIPKNKKGVPVSSTHQREALKKLEPMGFEPLGTDSKGYMIVQHPIGYVMSIASTPSDSKTMKNLLAEAERGVRRMGTANLQFQKWLWEKWSVEPGQHKLVELSLTGEIRQFFEENGIQRGGSHNPIAAWIRENKTLELADPDKRGPGPHVYKLNRPPNQFVVVEPIVQEPEPGQIVQAIPRPVIDEEPAQDEISAIFAKTSQAPPPTDVDADMVRQLQAILAKPVQDELNDTKEQLGLARSELETLENELNGQIAQLTRTRDLVANLRSVLEG